MASPLVTVIVPAHNAARFLGDTLRSVQRQTMPDFELLVVDDGSTDDTRQVAERFARTDARVRVLSQDNRGVAAARNRALRSASAPFLAPLDSDDLWHPRKLELQLGRFEAGDQRLGLVYTWTQRIDADGRILPRDTITMEAEGNVLADLIRSNIVGHASGALIRRECVEQAGGFDETLRAAGAQGCEDLALYLAIAERHEFAVVREYLVAYRRVMGTMSHDVWSMKRSHELVLQAARNRHPELGSRLFRQSRVEVNCWLATRTRNFWRDRMPLWWDSVKADPIFLLHPWFALKVWRVLRRTVLRRLIPERHYRMFTDLVLDSETGTPVVVPAVRHAARRLPASGDRAARRLPADAGRHRRVL